jgi:predicted GNAT superfamily acetyltransferase
MIEVRALTKHDEFNDAVNLQQVIWGFEEIELLPVRLFVTATKVGGQAFGGYDGKRMVAFCLAIPGIKSPDKIYLHSHMLGVLAEYRDKGVGRMLKLAQRVDAINRGIQLIEWTFDPLEIKNAYFNIERLGAVIRRFVFNQYGTTSSHLHAGLPTDRCFAEWYVSSKRVEAVLGGWTRERAPVVGRIAVPADIYTIKDNDVPRAREIQTRVSNSFQEYFSKGWVVTGFERGPETASYLFSEAGTHI